MTVAVAVTGQGQGQDRSRGRNRGRARPRKGQGHDMTGQNMAGLGWAGLGRTRQGRAGAWQDRRQERVGQCREQCIRQYRTQRTEGQGERHDRLRNRADDRTAKGEEYCGRRDIVQRNAGMTGHPVFLLGRSD